MTSVLLLQLDGKLPNLALLRIAAEERTRGSLVTFRRAPRAACVQAELGDEHFARVYASAIFDRTRPVAAEVVRAYPHALVGGTGVSITGRLEDVGIATDGPLDYSIAPHFTASLGFTQRGCRLRCPFCVVPEKEGAVRPVATLAQLWRGDPHPKHLHLLDNDFFGQPAWAALLDEAVAGDYAVSFTQGINLRSLTPEQAMALARVDFRDDGFRKRRIYTAWDNRKDEARLFRGLELLRDAGVRPREIMVYILVGYWPGETHEDRDYRRARLREFGCIPYPMPFRRTSDLVNFQRWVNGNYDKRGVTWPMWTAARCQPRNLRREQLVLGNSA